MPDTFAPGDRNAAHPAWHRLLAERDIQHTLARYCRCLDEYDIDGVAACFTPDANSDYGPGRGGAVQGREAIAARIARGQAAFRRTHHQIGQTLVKLETPQAEVASSVAYVTAWHERWDQGRDVLCLRYVDQLRRVHAEWLIADRRVEVSYCDGFASVPWHWVRRAPADGARGPV